MLHASALCTSHYRNMLRLLETKPDIENTRGSPYRSKTSSQQKTSSSKSSRCVRIDQKCNSTTFSVTYGTALYLGIISIHCKYFVKGLLKVGEKVGLLSSLIKQTVQSLPVKRSKCACAFLILIFQTTNNVSHSEHQDYKQ